jgi:hypothetical protein
MVTRYELGMHGLGSRMRSVGRLLHPSTPITAQQASIAIGEVADVPYCMQVLLRLELRDIAKRVLVTSDEGPVKYDLGFVRGKDWDLAAHMYKWPMEVD